MPSVLTEQFLKEQVYAKPAFSQLFSPGEKKKEQKEQKAWLWFESWPGDSGVSITIYWDWKGFSLRISALYSGGDFFEVATKSHYHLLNVMIVCNHFTELCEGPPFCEKRYKKCQQLDYAETSANS